MHVDVGALHLDPHRQGRGEARHVARRLRPRQGGQGGLRNHLRRVDRDAFSVRFLLGCVKFFLQILCLKVHSTETEIDGANTLPRRGERPRLRQRCLQGARVGGGQGGAGHNLADREEVSGYQLRNNLNAVQTNCSCFQVSDEPAAGHHLLPGQPGERAAPRGPARGHADEQPRQEEAAEGAVHPQAALPDPAGALHGDQQRRGTPPAHRGAGGPQERALQVHLQALLQDTQAQSEGLQEEPGKRTIHPAYLSCKIGLIDGES